MHNHRGIMAVIICLLCVTIPSIFLGAVSAKDRPITTPIRTVASAKVSAKSAQLERTKVIRLKKVINTKRSTTWRVQSAVHKPHTRTSYAERRVNSPAFLAWEAKLWNKRLLAVRKYARSIFANHGYLPPFQARILGQRMAAQRGWTGQQWICLDQLWGRSKYGTLESGWFAKADNPHSSAHGIPQALPGSKMGKGWETSAFVQIKWGLGYIRGRYSSPCGALSFRLKNHWY